MSVRDSAHAFHTPAAQFSVSKYQFMPHTGAVAVTIAATGSPLWSARFSDAGTEYRPARIRIANRILQRSHASATRIVQPLPPVSI